MDQANSQPEEKDIQPQKPVHASLQLPLTILVGLIMFFVGLGFGYLLFANKIQPDMTGKVPQPTTAQQPTATSIPSSWPVHPIQQPYAIISSNKISPTGEYVVKQGEDINKPPLTLLDDKNKVLVEDLLESNTEEIGYNKKFGCQCGISFKGWYSSTQFVILVVNGNGEQYEFLVSVPDGKVNESSFRRIPDLKN